MVTHDIVPGTKPRLLVIGLGNEYRHDDAVGIVIARRLEDRARGTVKFVTERGEGSAMLDVWDGADLVLLVDAVYSGAEAGTIYRFDAIAEPIPTNFSRFSTHAFSLTEAIELARALKRLPPRLLVYGIEGGNFTNGEGLSPEVEESAQEVIESILRDVQQALAPAQEQFDHA